MDGVVDAVDGVVDAVDGVVDAEDGNVGDGIELGSDGVVGSPLGKVVEVDVP